MKKFKSVLFFLMICTLLVLAGCNRNVSIQTSIGSFELGQNPENLVRLLDEEGIDVIVSPYQDFEAIGIDNPVVDGRMYNFDSSFSFTTEDIVFHYDSNGFQQSMVVLSPNPQTDAGVGVGDSRARVIEAHGNNYSAPENPMFGHIIEYSDGETYLVFVFGDDRVFSWSLSRQSVFEEFDSAYPNDSSYAG